MITYTHFNTKNCFPHSINLSKIIYKLIINFIFFIYVNIDNLKNAILVIFDFPMITLPLTLNLELHFSGHKALCLDIVYQDVVLQLCKHRNDFNAILHSTKYQHLKL